ncbi:MAG: TonB-dependent receptor plug domain-containing protein [Hyphomicrobiales bacterium]
MRHAADALRGLPGVTVSRSGSFGALTQVRIRGAEANHTLVLIDGIEANAVSEGEFDFSNLLVEDIERIEVIRGPQSGLYGSNALAGVVNIVTKDGRGPAQLVLRTEGGSFDTAGFGITASGGTDKLHGIATIQGRSTNGFNISPEGTEDDGSRIGAFSVRAGWQALDWLKIEGIWRHSEKTGDRDDQIPTLARLGLLQPNEDTPSNFRTDINMGSLEATIDPFDGRWIQKLRTRFNETSASDYQLPPAFADRARNDSTLQNYGYLTTWNHQAPGFLGSVHSLSGLVEHDDERFTPVFNDNIQRSRARDSFAAEYRGTFLDRFTFAANYRFEDNDKFEDFSTYRLSGSLAVPRTTVRLHGSAGTGVKYPTMFEQFGSLPSFGFVSNPDLLPEESFGWDIGAEKTLFGGALLIDVTYFNADLKNKIETVFAPQFTAINLPGTSKREGIEVAANARLGDRWSLSGAYTHLDAKLPDERQEIRRPHHSGRVDVGYDFREGRGNVQLGVQFNGDMQDDGLRNISSFGFPGFEEQRVILDAYTLVSLAATYEIARGVQLLGRIENMLDEGYQEVYGFESPGIAAYAGLRVQLGGPDGAAQ